MHAEKSGLVPTLIGGVIGAVAGIALQVVLETGMLGQRMEASWCAVVIGVLTGLGVRQANKHHMDRSYVRGAISGLIALAAIVASSFAIKEVMSRREVAPLRGQQAAAAKADAKDAADETDDAAAEPADAPARDAADADRPAGSLGAAPPRALSSNLNPWQFVFMALGGLFAYELGRGADPAKRNAADAAESEAPLVGGTDPSN